MTYSEAMDQPQVPWVVGIGSKWQDGNPHLRHGVFEDCCHHHHHHHHHHHQDDDDDDDEEEEDDHNDDDNDDDDDDEEEEEEEQEDDDDDDHDDDFDHNDGWVVDWRLGTVPQVVMTKWQQQHSPATLRLQSSSNPPKSTSSGLNAFEDKRL